MTAADKTMALIRAIAMREGTASELAKRFNLTPEELRTFTRWNLDEIKAYAANPPDSEPAEPTPSELAELWITNKTERLRRLQQVADIAYDALIGEDASMSPAELATLTREFRSYLTSAANELGQLLNRGAGDSADGSYLSVELNGVNMDDMR